MVAVRVVAVRVVAVRVVAVRTVCVWVVIVRGSLHPSSMFSLVENWVACCFSLETCNFIHYNIVRDSEC